MTQQTQPDRETTAQGMHVKFTLYKGDTPLIGGSFIAVKSEAFSCFGRHVAGQVRTPGGVGLETYFFEGVTVQFSFDDEGTSLSLKLYEVAGTEDGPVPYEQNLRLTAALQLGMYSGSEKTEAVMLGNSHQFVFDTRLVH